MLRRACRVSLAMMLVVIAACGREPPAPVPEPPAPAARPQAVEPAAPPEAPVASGKPPVLPEDPIAGKRSEQQWREHLDEEEEERQLLFDRQRLKQHRAAVKLITTARTRLDRARSEAVLTKVRADMPKTVATLHGMVKEMDPWGVNSRLLPDYAAMESVLGGTYADAKLAALRGEGDALKQARAEFEQRVKKMNGWLEEAAESAHTTEAEREAKREREGEHERERERPNR